MRRHPTAPVNVARISVATSGTDFTAPKADFAALIRAAGFSWEITFVTWSCRSWDSAWSAPGTFETCRRTLKMSAYRGEPEVIGRRSE